MKNEVKSKKLEILKKELNFVELDQRLEMIKIPTLSALACQEGSAIGQNNGCGNNVTLNGQCNPTTNPQPPLQDPAPHPKDTIPKQN